MHDELVLFYFFHSCEGGGGWQKVLLYCCGYWAYWTFSGGRWM